MKQVLFYLFLGWQLLFILIFFSCESASRTQSSGSTSHFQKPTILKSMSISNFTPQNTAIIVIEFQKTWTEKGFFHWLIKKELKDRKVVQNSIAFLDKARQGGYPIIQAPLILDKTKKEQYKKMPFIPKFFNAFTANTWKAEFTEGIYQSTDLMVTGRCAFDACEGSNLETIITDLGVKNLLFMGFTTEHCVEMTMKTLIDKGYNCGLVADCTATKSNRLQKQVEERQKKIQSTDLFPFLRIRYMPLI